MTVAKFKKGFKTVEETKWEGDNAFQGLQIIAKYMDPKKHNLICGADHDIIFSVYVKEIVEAGITEEDATALQKLNWSLSDDEDYLTCFV